MREIEGKGGKAAALQLNVGDTASFSRFAQKVKDTLKHVWQCDTFDYLVNNAGTGLYAPYTETTEAQFDDALNIHFKGPFFLTQQLLPLIKDGGRILNVSSGLARFTQPGSGTYAAMKGAMEVLTRYQAKELGARGISVNIIAPGAIETDFGAGECGIMRSLTSCWPRRQRWDAWACPMILVTPLRRCSVTNWAG